MAVGKAILALVAAGAAVTGATFAHAAQPVPWGIGLQEAVTPVMERITSFNDLVFIIALVITVFVMVLLLYVVFRFSAKRNPVPSKTTHNTLIEVLWTVVPIIVLVVIAIPSFRLLYFTDRTEEAEMTIKAIGHQWYWSYEYPDFRRLEPRFVHDRGPGRARGRPTVAARDRHPGGAAGRHDDPRLGNRRRRHSLLGDAGLRHQGRRRARPAQRDLGCGSSARASITDNARSYAASTTRSCRSRSRWSRRTPSRPGWRRRRRRPGMRTTRRGLRWRQTRRARASTKRDKRP